MANIATITNNIISALSGTTSQVLLGDATLTDFKLDSLTDVNVPTPGDGDVLKWNGTTLLWEASDAAGVTGSGSAGQVAYFTGSTTQTGNNNLFWDNTNGRLGIGTNTPILPLSVVGNAIIGQSNAFATLTVGKAASANWGANIIIHGYNNTLKNFEIGVGSQASNFTITPSTVDGGNTYTTPALSISRISNVSIGSTVDNGLRLQVTGDGFFSGGIGLGATALTGYNMRISKTLTGSTAVFGISQVSAIQADVLASTDYFYTNANTQAASFTLGVLRHYLATQGTFGAGSIVQNQYGFFVAPMTGATNNYGFYGDIASGTGRWNLYMNGTANNYLAGNIMLGRTSSYGFWQSNLTSAEARLGVFYSDSSTSLNDANAGLVIMNTNTTASTSSKLVFGAFNADPVPVSLAYISAVNTTRSSGYMAANLIFATATLSGSGTGPTEKMRLDNAGNLGLGVVPSAWDSVYRVFQIGGNPALASQEAVQMVANGYYNAGWKYIANNYAARYEINKNNGGIHAWYNAPSGTLGQPITFTQAMTLDASGYLFVGGLRLKGSDTTNTIYAGSSNMAITAEAGYNISIGRVSDTSKSINVNTTTGNLLIGTTTDAGFRLDVNGTMKVTGASTFGENITISKNHNGFTTLTISNTTSGTSSAAYAQFTSSNGNLQIGKRSATSSVYKILAANDSFILNDSSGDIAIFNGNASGSIKMAAGDSSTAHFTIASTGAATFSSSVTATSGILGTAKTSGTGTATLMLSGGVSDTREIGYVFSAASTREVGAKISFIGSGNTGGNQGAYITFATSAAGDASLNERMRLDVAGNLGIGTSSPAYKLDVTGTARVTGDITGDSNLILGTLAGADNSIRINGHNTAYSLIDSNAGYDTSYNGLMIRSNANNGNSRPDWQLDLGGRDASFGTDHFVISRLPSGGSNTRLLRISDTGVATFASTITATGATINGNSTIVGGATWTTGVVATQFFGDIYGSIKYDYATTNFTINSYGLFSIATNGTSPTTKLTVYADGNTQIGGSSNTGEKLQVNGTMRVSGASTFGADTYKIRSVSDAGGAGWGTVGGVGTHPQIYLYQAGTSAIVQTYINGVARLEVTNTGIGVTGAATFSSNVTVGGTQRIINSNNLRFTKSSVDSIYFADIWFSSTDSLQISSVTNSIKLGGGGPTAFTEYIGIASGGATTFVSTATAASFIPTSSTAPSNGIYLPAANSVAISTNSTNRLSVSSLGVVKVANLAGSGTAIVITDNAGNLSTQPTSTYLTSLSGEATNSGSAVTLTNSAVIGKVLTGLNVYSAAIAATDSILAAFGKIQGQIDGLQGGTIYKGSWNASTNTPTITSGTGTQGNYYVVTTAGTTTIDGVSSWAVGDWIIFNGTVWEKIPNVDAITSVNGQTGVVSLTTSNINEGTNLYYTDTRARAAISLTTIGDSGASTYSSGVLNIPTYTLAGLGGAAAATTITINGTAQDLSASRTFSVGTVTSVSGTGTVSGLTLTGSITNSGSLTLGGTLTLTSGNVTTALGFTPYNSTNPAGYTTNTGTVTSIVAGTYLTGGTITTSGTIAVDATTTNTADKIVARDASGNFSAGTITATLTGTASNATTLGTLSLQSAGAAPGANQVLRTDGSGYSYFGYINSSTGNAENPAISQIIVTNGSDNFYRKASLAHLTSAVQGAASGSWGISVTGNAATVGGLSIHTDRNNEVNKIVRTDANGYIQAGWINTTSGDNGTTAIDRIYASSDAYIRYYTPANFRTVLDVPTRTGGSASGTWAISVTGNAATATNVAYSGLTGTVPTWNQNTTGNAATASTSSQVTINYSNNSDASYQMLWGSGNSVYGTAGITCNPFTDTVNLTGTLNSAGLGVVGFGRMYGGDFWHSGTANNGTRTPTLKLGRFSDSETPAYIVYTNDTDTDTLEFFSERYAGDFRLTRNSDTGLRNMMRVNSDNNGTVLDLYAGDGSTLGVKLQSNGDARFAYDVVAYYSFSDARLKKNVATIENPLQKVMAMRGVSYEWNEGYKIGKKEIGLIAQEVMEIIPEVVAEKERVDGSKFLRVDYEHLTGLLIEAVKELKREVDELKSK